jgi:dynein light chain 1
LNFVGNPIYEQAKEEPLIIILKKIMTLKNIDGKIIDESILERVRGTE